jgi:hypothetical protein
MIIWSILQPFGIFCYHLVPKCYGFLVHFSRFGLLYQEISGKPALNEMNYGAAKKYQEREGDQSDFCK